MWCSNFLFSIFTLFSLSFYNCYPIDHSNFFYPPALAIHFLMNWIKFITKQERHNDEKIDSGSYVSFLFHMFGNARGFVSSFNEWVQKLKSPQIHHSNSLHTYKILSFMLKLTLAWSLCFSVIPISKMSIYSFFFPFRHLIQCSQIYLYLLMFLYICSMHDLDLSFLCLDLLYHIWYHPLPMLLINASINLKYVVHV